MVGFDVFLEFACIERLSSCFNLELVVYKVPTEIGEAFAHAQWSFQFRGICVQQLLETNQRLPNTGSQSGSWIVSKEGISIRFQQVHATVHIDHPI